MSDGLPEYPPVVAEIVDGEEAEGGDDGERVLVQREVRAPALQLHRRHHQRPVAQAQQVQRTVLGIQ